MDITKSSTNGTQSNFISSESFSTFILEFLVFMISSSLFWIGISLAILIHFSIRYIFRVSKFDSVPKSGDETEDIWGKEIFTGFDYIWDQNHESFWDNSFKNHDYFLDNNEKYHDNISDNNEIYHDNFSDNNEKYHDNISDNKEKYNSNDLKQDKKVETLEENDKFESTFSFKFEYQIPQIAQEGFKEEKLPNLNELPNSNEKPVSTNIQNYQFVSEKNLQGFVEPTETLKVSVKESLKGFVEPTETLKVSVKESSTESKFDTKPNNLELTEPKLETKYETESESESQTKLEFESKPKLESEYKEREVDMKSHVNLCEEFDNESWCENEPEYTNNVESLSPKDEITPVNKCIYNPKRISSSSPSTVSNKSGRKIVSEEFSGFDSDSESSLSDGYSVKDLIVESDNDWFLSEKGSGNYLHKYTLKFMDDIGDFNESRDHFAYINDRLVIGDLDNSKIQFEEEKLEEDDNFGELEALKETNLEAKISLDTGFNDYDEGKFYSYNENSVPINDEFLDRGPHENYYELDIGKPSQEPETDLKKKGKEYLEEEEEENDELESLWEHQDLIEQLKMEIKKAKAVGLPTILEESETPKTTIEDLKPFRFDEKFLREDPMDELHKFYKSYRERMRKFDILNYQKMYAIGFLQLKDPLESMGSQKPILPTITSILYKRRKSYDDPSERFIRELRCDLETVYVGQMCLSWEFLRWQYEKTCEMTEPDTFRGHQYNQSAGEFQQFQVLINRFVENEPFQVPRLPNYVKNRCVLRNLLQVPIIKEDSLMEKSEEQKKGNYAITAEELEDIMEESIRVFWEFVKADKDETPGILKGLMGPQVELQEPSDFAFMMHLHSILQKKEKRLKDLLRTGNCLVKKFKKPKEDRSNQDLFFSHVDIKLVSRVLKMPRITSEQLQWCQRKLERISFVDRKIRREPSFLLFPC